MKMLLIHTCGIEGSVALADIAVIATASLPARTFSERLMPCIRMVLESAGWSVGNLEAVAVVSGPGSFTGVRTGLSVGKGLCEALDIPLVAVSRLALLAGRTGLVHAVLDAGREEFYYGRYRDGVQEVEALYGREALAEAVATGGRIAACEEKVFAALAGWSLDRVPEPAAGDALGLAQAALAAGGNDVLSDANYLRRTDGEIFAKAVTG